MKGLAVYRVVRSVSNATELSRTLLTIVINPNPDDIPTLTSSLNTLAVVQFNPMPIPTLLTILKQLIFKT